MSSTFDHAFFYDSNDGDRKYNAESFEHWLKKFFTTGVFSGELKVLANGGMSVAVSSGYCNVEGKVRVFKDDTILTVDTAGAVYDRIDTVVIERNDTERDVTLKVVKGTETSSPVPTDLVRKSGIYQLVIAKIKIKAGAVEITQADITDTREYKELCGIVTGTVKELDFSQLKAQFDDFYNQCDMKFYQWMEKLEGQLGTDVAGSLLQLIEVERARINEFTSLKEGSTTGDAELQDIRVGANGKRYETAGEAVREQFADATADIEKNKEKIKGIVTDFAAPENAYNSSDIYLSDVSFDSFQATDDVGIGTYIGSYEFLYPSQFGHISNGFYTHVLYVSKGDRLVLGDGYNLEGTQQNCRLLIAGTGDIVAKIIPFEELNEARFCEIEEDGFVYISACYSNEPLNTKIASLKTSKFPTSGSSVGQVMVVKKVDENGKPTKWETTDKISQLTNDAGYITQQDLDGIAQYYVTEISTALKSGAAYTNSAVVSGLKIGSSWDGIDAHKETKRGYHIWSANALSSQILDFSDSVLKDATLYVVTDGVVKDIVNYQDFTKSKTYKFTTTSSKYAITAEISDGKTVFVNCGEYSQSQRPNQEDRTEIEILNGSESEVFKLRDVNAAKYLYFHKDASKLYFDRCYPTSGVNDDFELYIPSEDSTSPIKGYKKVTSISQITTGMRCLIVSRGEDGCYYVMRPMLRGFNYEYVAKVISVGDGMIGQLATAAAQFDGAYIELEKCLYTFDCDNMIYISAKTTGAAKESDLAFKVQKLEDFSGIRRRLEDLSNIKADLKEIAEQMNDHRTVLYGELGVQIDPATEKKYTIPVTEGPIRNTLIKACTDAGTTADKIFDKLRMVVDFGGSAARQAVSLETTSPLSSDAVIAPIALAGDDDAVYIGSIQYDRLKYEFVIKVPEGCCADTYEFSVYLERL